MDAFTIVTGVVGLAQGLSGLVKLTGELLESIEKVSKNRQKAKQLATDTSQIIKTIQAFHAKYADVFTEDQDLQELVENLHTSLSKIVDKCKEMEPKPENGTLRNKVARLRAWLKRDELEGRLADLNNQAQQCQIKFMTLSTLSTNVTAHKMSAGIARIAASVSSFPQRIVVQRSPREPVSRDSSHSCVDPTYTHIASGPPIRILKCPHSHLSDDDVVKHAFLRLQVKNIDNLLSNLLQSPNLPFNIPSPQFDDPTYTRTMLHSEIPWEEIQHLTALESTQLINKIRRADSSISIVDVCTALTYLGYRYEHLDMCHEAFMLSTLAVQLARLAAKVYPHSDSLQMKLAVRLENYACLLPSRGPSVVVATQCMVEAVSIYQQLAAKLPLPGRKLNLADSLSKSSSLARWTGDFDTAESHSTAALDIILEVLGAPPGSIPGTDALQLTDWAGIERDGLLLVHEWQDQGVLVYAGVLEERFRCTLAQESFPDAYKHGRAAREVCQMIAKHHPQYSLPGLLEITTDLLEDWAEPFRSDVDTITLCADALRYLSAIPSHKDDLGDSDTLFEKYTLQAKMSILLHNANDPSAVEAQRTASLYWDQYYAAYIKATPRASSPFEARQLALTFCKFGCTVLPTETDTLLWQIPAPIQQSPCQSNQPSAS